MVLALAEDVLRAPPAVDWILEAFRGPKSTGGVPFQPQDRELGHPPAFPHLGSSNSIISPVFSVKMS